MQAPPIREDGLQIDESREFQRRFWSVQRWSWVLFTLLLGLALAGLTGAGGYFSRTSSTLPGGSIDHPCITRWEYPEEITVRVEATATTRRCSTARPPYWSA